MEIFYFIYKQTRITTFSAKKLTFSIFLVNIVKQHETKNKEKPSSDKINGFSLFEYNTSVLIY